ncbi:Qat anti-phage system associated protein QatB [Hyphococcus sp.]|uniref:Qat anti-phage system associated protein QatB n=1 Tax=Hyphococcus sp. TaxID=2038636 RepID=UPI0035C67ADE
MGTSGSSNGPGPDVPMVPPWADPAPNGGDAPENPDGGDGGSNGDADNGGDAPTVPRPTVPVAPSGRFAGARRHLGSFSRSGNTGDMRRGISQYVSRGYGGSGTSARRMGKTAQTAAGLSNALSGGGGGGDATLAATINELRGRSANEIINGVVDAVAPIDGSQDVEASRESIREVLADLIAERPDADLLNLDDESRDVVVEQFIAADVYRRIVLDVGKKIQDAAPNAKVALQRLRQVKDYVKETVKYAFNSVRDKLGSSKSANVGKISHDALRETFEVFEAYTQ